MIDREINNGNTELQEAKILNMAVAKYYGVVKEYAEILTASRELNAKEIAKNKEKAELNLIYSVRYNLNLMVKEKLNENNYEN
jgi:ribosomal protein S13